MAASALRYAEVTKDYRGGVGVGRVRALEDFSLSIEAGTVVGLMGPNGCGKSTALKCALGWVEIDAGEITIQGKDATVRRDRPAIGFMPDSGGVPTHLTGRETLRWWAKVCAVKGSRVDELLEEVDLAAAADRSVASYSRGMCRRLALAQAILSAPALLLMDEPFSGVDPIGVDRMVEIIGRQRANGCAVLLTSHLMPRMAEICDQVVMLNRGRSIAQGSPSELLGNDGPATRGWDEVFRERMKGQDR